LLDDFIHESVSDEEVNSAFLLVSITLPVDSLLVLENPVNSEETETELDEDIIPSANICLNFSNVMSGEIA